VRCERRQLATLLLPLWVAVQPAAAEEKAKATPLVLNIPDVAFLPQTTALCGGAALAMVLRYWGEPGVGPQDFASALEASGRGITTDHLRQLAEQRGYDAFAHRADRNGAVEHLAKGRPLIALARASRGRFHYVVLLAWANGRVLLHDPALGPFRVLNEEEWMRRWNDAGRWTLLVLPSKPSGAPLTSRAETGMEGAATASAADTACGALVRPALDQAAAGDVESAKGRLAAAAELCPESSAPLREMAGLEFRRERWSEAAELAEKAAARDPDDHLAWRLAATSRFLAGQPDAALGAWNQIAEPSLDLVRIEGLVRTPYRTVHDFIDGSSGELLTADAMRRTRRRLASLPTLQAARVGIRPHPGGRADLEVAVVEQPRIERPRILLVEGAARAATDHGLALDLANLTSTGDALHVFGRWQDQRPQLSVVAAAPRALGLPGVITVGMLWDEQTYRLEPAAAPIRERRQRMSLGVDDWWTADTRAGLTLALDDWSGRGSFVTAAGEIERRLGADRLSIGGRGTGFFSTGSSKPFYAGSLWLSARTTLGASRKATIRLEGSFDAVGSEAPLALWPGAGTGQGRSHLLRAHPLLDRGILEGPCFGRQLLRASLEGELPLRYFGPTRLSAAAFVDAAHVLVPAPGSVAPRSFLDLGLGLRLRLSGRSVLRLDVATPWGSLVPRVSMAVQR
jgi:tetratricopeptide (TPR) repeat protein